MDFYKWVIDPNVLTSYCISRRLHELPILIEKHNIEICASQKLVLEFSEVMSRDRIKALLSENSDFYINIVSKFLSLYSIEHKFIGSPDKKDDYLFDIVLQTNAVGLVTGDKFLIRWKRTPVQIITWHDFQLTYPV